MINKFEREYAWLSNFYEKTFLFRGKLVKTAEHAYQAAKTIVISEQQKVLNATSAGLAKRYGRSVSIRTDWEEIKLDVMLAVLRAKFENTKLASLLIATNDEELIEGNWWGDHFWGVSRGYGENHLGKLLMKVRNEL